MTATLTPAPVATTTHSTSAGHLPKWAPWALLLIAFVVSGTIFAFMNAGESANGERPRGMKLLMSSGRTTGSSFSGTGCGPHFAQWMIGMGQPQ